MLPDLHCSNEQREAETAWNLSVQVESAGSMQAGLQQLLFIILLLLRPRQRLDSLEVFLWLPLGFTPLHKSFCSYRHPFTRLSALISRSPLHSLIFWHTDRNPVWTLERPNLKHPLKKREWPSSAKRRACTCRVHTVTGKILHCKGYCSQSMWVTCTLCTWS